MLDATRNAPDGFSGIVLEALALASRTSCRSPSRSQSRFRMNRAVLREISSRCKRLSQRTQSLTVLSSIRTSQKFTAFGIYMHPPSRNYWRSIRVADSTWVPWHSRKHLSTSRLIYKDYKHGTTNINLHGAFFATYVVRAGMVQITFRQRLCAS